MNNRDSTYTGFVFKKYEAPELSIFDKLLDIFKELITHTSGDVDEAFNWLEQLDKTYEITTPEYTLEDFKRDLFEK